MLAPADTAAYGAFTAEYLGQQAFRGAAMG
jgi:hypothetical protein